MREWVRFATLLVGVGVCVGCTQQVGGLPSAAVDSVVPPGEREDWLAKDIALIARIQTHLPPRDVDVETFLKRIGATSPDRSTSTGFGGERIELAIYGGYTTQWVTLIVDRSAKKGSIAEIAIRCKGSSESWPRIKDRLREAWRVKVTPGDASEWTYRWRDEAAIAAIEAGTSARLGVAPTPRAETPQEYLDALSVLSDPTHIYDFGDACYYAGTPPAGQVATDGLVNGGRFDLLKIALRGRNPEGRIHAARALTTANKLDDADLDAIRALRALSIPIRTCNGCSISEQVAAELLPDPD